MKITIKLIIVSILAANISVITQSFSKDVLVNVYQYDPFDVNKKHPLARVNLEVVESDFGAISDVKCSKSAMDTGLAKCRYVNSQCNATIKSEVKYLVQLEREKTGLVLKDNIFDLVVDYCEIIPPSDFTFIYNSKKIEIYEKSNSNISTQISFIETSQLKDQSLWSNSSANEKLNKYFQDTESTQVIDNIRDSNNLAVMYASIAHSYSPDSEKYNEYQIIAKSYEKLSVLNANNGLSKAFAQTLSNIGQEIKITNQLKDYLNNINKIKNNKTGIINNCNNCNQIKLEEGINLIVEDSKLNAKSIKAMKEVKQAMNDMGINNG